MPSVKLQVSRLRLTHLILSARVMLIVNFRTPTFYCFVLVARDRVGALQGEGVMIEVSLSQI